MSEVLEAARGSPIRVAEASSLSRKMPSSAMAKIEARSCADHHDRGPEVLVDLEDQLVEPAGRDRIQPRRRLVEEQEIRIERHRPRQPRPLLHAAGELVGVQVLEAGEAHQRELEPDQLDLRAERGELLERRATFSATVKLLQSAPNWNSTPARRSIACRSSGGARVKLRPS